MNNNCIHGKVKLQQYTETAYTVEHQLCTANANEEHDVMVWRPWLEQKTVIILTSPYLCLSPHPETCPALHKA